MTTRLIILILMSVATILAGNCHGDIISMQIIDFRDDAEEEITGPNAGNVFRSSSDLEFGNQNLVEQWVGLRFRDLEIPSGSVINSAFIELTATTTDVGTLTIPIFGELSADTIEFGDLTPLTTRPPTLSEVLWDAQPWFPGDFGPNTTTPDLTQIVQEIVDLNGWSAGNAMVFLFRNDPLDTSERIAVSFDGDPLNAAILTVDFTPQMVPEPSGFLLLLFVALLGMTSLGRRKESARVPVPV